MTPEVRSIRSFELRAAADDDFALEGTAISYDTLSQDVGGFRERIMPGAFTRSLKEGADVKCLMNHDPNFLLGRTKSGTLQLAQKRIAGDKHVPARSERMHCRLRPLREKLGYLFTLLVIKGREPWERLAHRAIEGRRDAPYTPVAVCPLCKLVSLVLLDAVRWVGHDPMN